MAKMRIRGSFFLSNCATRRSLWRSCQNGQNENKTRLAATFPVVKQQCLLLSKLRVELRQSENDGSAKPTLDASEVERSYAFPETLCARRKVGLEAMNWAVKFGQQTIPVSEVPPEYLSFAAELWSLLGSKTTGVARSLRRDRSLLRCP